MVSHDCRALDMSYLKLVLCFTALFVSGDFSDSASIFLNRRDKLMKEYKLLT